MENLEQTLEQKISSLFDSVNLIIKLKLIEEPSQEELIMIENNIEHLKTKLESEEYLYLSKKEQNKLKAILQ